MRKKLFFLFLFIISTFSTFAFDDWLRYGQNLASTHYISTSGGNLDFTSFNLSIGQIFEPIVTNLTENLSLDLIIWNGTRIFIVNLSDGNIIANFLIGVELTGQPTFFNGRYFALVKNGNDSSFYKLNITKTNFSLDFSFKIGDFDDVELQGIKCVQSSETNWCIFMDINNTIYRFNISSNSFSTFKVTNGIRNTTKLFLRVPAIGDLDGNGDFEAIFPFTNATDMNCPNCVQHPNLFVYDIDTNDSFNFFDSDGYLRVIHNSDINPINMSSPIIHNFDGGLPEIVIITDDASNAQLKVYNSSGSLRANGTSGNDFDGFTQPFIAKCDFNTTGLELGVGYFSYDTGAHNTYKFVWIDSSFNEHKVDKNLGGGAFDSTSFRSGQIVSTANFDDSLSSEIIASLSYQTNIGRKLSVFSCDETSNTQVGDVKKNISSFDDVLIPIIVDFNNDGGLDIIATTSDRTSIHKPNVTTADLEILEIIPIQVVGGVDMVLGKTGLARVNVKSNGPLDANATVKMTFEGNLLFDSDVGNSTNITKLISTNQNASFDFRFKPTQTGSQLFTANVSIS